MTVSVTLFCIFELGFCVIELSKIGTFLVKLYVSNICVSTKRYFDLNAGKIFTILDMEMGIKYGIQYDYTIW